MPPGWRNIQVGCLPVLARDKRIIPLGDGEDSEPAALSGVSEPGGPPRGPVTLVGRSGTSRSSRLDDVRTCLTPDQARAMPVQDLEFRDRANAGQELAGAARFSQSSAPQLAREGRR